MKRQLFSACETPRSMCLFSSAYGALQISLWLRLWLYSILSKLYDA